jgi:hypothetical protein
MAGEMWGAVARRGSSQSRSSDRAVGIESMPVVGDLPALTLLFLVTASLNLMMQ